VIFVAVIGLSVTQLLKGAAQLYRTRMLARCSIDPSQDAPRVPAYGELVRRPAEEAMNLLISILVTGLIAAFPAGAAASPPTGSKAGAYPMDCAKWKDAGRCAAFNDRIAACRDKTDDAWLQCMYPNERRATFTPPKAPDCSQASNRELCETHAAVLDACRHKTTRAEYRDCLAARLQTSAFKRR
jgi:hypothetical protein